MSAVRLTLHTGKVIEVPAGTTLEEISNIPGAVDSPSPVMAAMVNDKMTELSFPMIDDARVLFLTLGNMDGYRIFQRSLIMLFLRCAYEVLGKDVRVYVKYALKTGLYCDVDGSKEMDTDPENCARRIKEKMWYYVDHPEPISQMLLDLPDAIDLSKEQNMPARTRLFTYRRFSYVHMYRFGHYEDYLYGFMLPNSARLGHFDLEAYADGLMLMMPSRTYPHDVPQVPDMPKLFSIFEESRDWSRILHVADIGALNEQISDGKLQQLIYTSEALHAKHIANIAEEISARGNIKLVLIAGPSSSGKTTFARKLAIQLLAEGKTPHLISIDNYFVDRDAMIPDENGKLDFEAFDAVDLERFQNDMKQLLSGKTVEVPVFDFVTGKRKDKGLPMTLKENDILILEGIHCLNEKLSEIIPRDEKFKIYISALTQLGIDEHNRIPTTDGRLLRRIVRDHARRGVSAQETIARWESVRHGEDRNIFPYQEEADVMFNSALPYEMAVLKQFAEPMLFRIQHGTPEYAEARRLIKFLDYFQGVSSEEVPSTSLLREFIGGSAYENLDHFG
ncbi:MAG: nucleoside kinase [Firmicutes bacterium]|nr:nucleoside kinase [Bacillota bacterium]